MRIPPKAPTFRLQLLLTVALAVFAAGACSSTPTSVEGHSDPDDSAAQPMLGTGTTSTTSAADACTAATLAAATANRFPDVEILDVACSAAAALATLETGSLSGGSGVGVYVAGPDGEWLLALSFEDEAALVAGAPPQVPRALITTWQDKVETRRNPPPPPPPPTSQPPATGVQGE